jgi:hypothetical protein
MPTMIRIALLALASALCGCGSPETPASSTTRIPADIRAEAPAFELARPNVVMEADPPPPFTYWAPEGAVIRNHGNAGVWVAYVDGRNVATYFGDECRASELQRFVGQPLSAMPAPAEGIAIRSSCTTCAVNDDLRRNRVNVVFQEETQRVVSIACY